MNLLIKQLKKITPGVRYQEGKSCYWSPEQRTITYSIAKEQPAADWTLLHEAAHALLDHTEYHSDVDLLLMEVAAWEKAKAIGSELNIEIDEDHIQECLDTYRDWLHRRSTCPRCSTVSIQISEREYSCHNCQAMWKVSDSRFGRPYRQTTQALSNLKSRPGIAPRTTFQ